MKGLITTLFIMLLFFISCEPPNRTHTGGLFNMKDKGIQLPSMSINTFEGKSIELSQIVSTDKIKLISFWATWCGPCNLEYNAIKSKYSKWAEKYNFEIIAISIDKEKMYSSLPMYIDQKNWPFSFFYDKDESLSKALNISNIPYSILIDRKGNVVHIDQAYHESFWIEIEAMLKKL